MSDPLRRCAAHGAFGGTACPDCGAAGSEVLDADRRERLSKFVSGALRHFPDDAGLDLDEGGWARWESLVAAAAERYPWADAPVLRALVAADPKGRFERRDDRVRAAYGHSVDVTLDADGGEVPDVLYHGTAPQHLDAIRAEGLRPMDRNEVHLSPDRETARSVGARHADDPVVLTVDASGLADAGHAVTRRGPETFTVDRVPPEFLD